MLFYEWQYLAHLAKIKIISLKIFIRFYCRASAVSQYVELELYLGVLVSVNMMESLSGDFLS